MLVSIDPGVKVAGIALWENSDLMAAWLVKSDQYRMGCAVIGEISSRVPVELISALAIEKPQIYHQSKLKGDPADLIELAIRVGAIISHVDPCGDRTTTYLPQAWKGSSPKDVMVERIKRRLMSDECARVELPRAKGVAHNVWDAVGIGLHHLKRRTT